MVGLNRKTKAQAVPRRRWLALFVIFMAALSAWGDAASQEESSASQVKAAYLFKFAEFVEWPPSAFPEPDMPFVMGVLGRDPFGTSLDEIVRDKTVRGRPIIVQRFRRVSEAENAHILYIDTARKNNLDRILTRLRDRSILTVSDEARGSMGIINFITVNHEVRFEISPEAADRAGLKISSKLLDLAAPAGDVR